jgi:hypothetical protein
MRRLGGLTCPSRRPQVTAVDRSVPLLRPANGPAIS